MAAVPTGSRNSNRGKAAAAALAAIELRGTPDVARYMSTLREMTRSIAMEVDLTAHELQGKLDRGGRTIDRFAAKAAARRVTRRLRMSSDHLLAAGDAAAKCWAEYSKTYSDLINPGSSRRQAWQWSENGRPRRPS